MSPCFCFFPFFICVFSPSGYYCFLWFHSYADKCLQSQSGGFSVSSLTFIIEHWIDNGHIKPRFSPSQKSLPYFSIPPCISDAIIFSYNLIYRSRKLLETDFFNQEIYLHCHFILLAGSLLSYTQYTQNTFSISPQSAPSSTLSHPVKDLHSPCLLFILQLFATFHRIQLCSINNFPMFPCTLLISSLGPSDFLPPHQKLACQGVPPPLISYPPVLHRNFPTPHISALPEVPKMPYPQ